MNDESLARAMQLLGQFNDDLTRTVDAVYGTRWAEIEEVTALVAIARDSVITTRGLADVSGLGRRAISRLVTRLTDTDLVVTQPAPRDRRAVDVVLTPLGRARADELRARTAVLLHEGRELATELAVILDGDGLEWSPPVADPLTLLLEASRSGAKLVSYMPAATTQGRMAARQRAALVYVVAHQGVRPGALAEPLQVSHAGVAYLVDQLCEKKLIRRHRDEVEGDRRAVVLRATSAGVDAVTTVAHAIREERMPISRVFLRMVAWCAAEAPVAGDQRAHLPR